MAKKVLVISPVPSHPLNAGNRARVFSILSHIQEMGHELHFALIRKPPLGDEGLMREHWGSRFYCLPYCTPKTGRGLLERWRRHIGIEPKLSIDAWYDTSLSGFFTQLSAETKFDLVIVEYVFFSRALECFAEDVLKVVDTVDVFANRHEAMSKGGLQPDWYSASPDQEARGLTRADVVIAISEEDRQFLSELVERKVIKIGHLVPLHKPSVLLPCSNDLLFVGSANPMNVQAIQHFVQEILPSIRAIRSDVRLLVAGRVCERLADSNGCVKLGVVENLQSLFAQAAVVVNPMLFGTGLSIKTIEALGHSKCVVSTTSGARGLLQGRDEVFLVADSPDEFAGAVLQVLADKALAARLSNNAYTFAAQWNRANLETLGSLLAC